jgi:Uma2 family endonuclease
MTTVQTEQTFDDLLKLSDNGKLYELVRGQLVEKEMGAFSIWVVTQIARLIGNYLASNPRGWVMSEIPVDCFPWIANHGRRPDVAYFHRERMPVPQEVQTTVAPNWVVEVLSRHDNALDVEDKIDEYLKANVELVWVVNPQLRTVRVHAAEGPRIFHADDEITGAPAHRCFRSFARWSVISSRRPRTGKSSRDGKTVVRAESRHERL